MERTEIIKYITNSINRQPIQPA